MQKGWISMLKRIWIQTAGILLCLGGLLAVLSGCGQPQEESGSSASAETTAPQTTTQPAPTETTAAQVTGTGYCTADSMNVRGGPGTDYFAIGGLKYGERVEILGKEGDWYQIAFKEDVGYVSAQYIQSTPPPITSATAVTTAETDAAE